jgi:hypothetical protein
MVYYGVTRSVIRMTSYGGKSRLPTHFAHPATVSADQPPPPRPPRLLQFRRQPIHIRLEPRPIAVQLGRRSARAFSSSNMVATSHAMRKQLGEFLEMFSIIGSVQDTCKNRSQGGWPSRADTFGDLSNDAAAGLAVDFLVDLPDAEVG